MNEWRKTLVFMDVLPRCHGNVTLATLQVEYAVRSARPYTALGNVYPPVATQSLSRKLQPAARSVREAQTSRHGSGDRHRSRFHRRGGGTALAPRFLPQRRGHVHAARREPAPRGSL